MSTPTPGEAVETLPDTSEVLPDVVAKPVKPMQPVSSDASTTRRPASFTAPAVLAFVIGAGVLGAIAGRTLLRSHDTAAGAPGDTVATVNGVPIQAHDFYHRLEAAAGPQVLQQMVNEEIMLQFAKSQHALPDNSDIEARLAKARQEPDFAQKLKNSRQTEDDLRHSMMVSLSQAAVLGQGVTVSDAEVKAFYQKNIDPKNPTARYYSPPAVQLEVIVTPSDADAKQAILELASGAPFANVAAKYSKDGSAANGGVLAPLQLGRSQLSKLPQLEQAVFKMNVGQQMNLVKIGNAWWTMRCVGKTTATTMPFEKVQDDCKTAAMIAKGSPKNQKKMNSALAAFQKSAKITPVWPQYQSAPAAK